MVDFRDLHSQLARVEEATRMLQDSTVRWSASIRERLDDVGTFATRANQRLEAAEKVCEAACLWRLGRGLNPQGDLIAAIDAWLVAKGEKPDAES